MLVGIGIDLEQVGRFQRMLRRSPALLGQVFSLDEQRVFNAQPDPVAHFAAAFAVKEACFKALGRSWLESSLFWTDIELLSPLPSECPNVQLRGAASDRCRALGGDVVKVGLSVRGPFVIASILIFSMSPPHARDTSSLQEPHLELPDRTLSSPVHAHPP